MRTTHVTLARGAAALGAVLALAAGQVRLAAQTAAPTPEIDNVARSQAFVFERALRGAVEAGGQRLAKRALVLVPELTLSTEEATVRSVRLTGYGFFFDVQVPDIQSTVLLLDMMTARQQRMSPVQPVAETSASAAAGPVFDPSREYSSYVREALIDTILDTSGVLTLGPNEHLTVAVSGIDRPQPNPLYRSNPAKLVLTIKGADLAEFRQGRISREEARERILEERF
jgi:hypothetical protein|nr:MAG: hypothetical protein DIU54_08755 [Acidobacteriota bacterium]